MIISCSRRSDIPALYSDWFIRRIDSGSCTTVNPFHPKQVSTISLKPEDVTAIVFWTRNPSPLLKHLKYLDELEYKYYFLFTLNNFGKKYEKKNPLLKNSIELFHKLSDTIGPRKVIWRYDPVLITEDLNYDFHLKNFENLSKTLSGFTNKVIISKLSPYRKTLKRLKAIDESFCEKENNSASIDRLLKKLAKIAVANSMKMEICGSEKDYSKFGIEPAHCIDSSLLNELFGLDLEYAKDKSQRETCNCAISKDIGTYNTCSLGCFYCYANK
ncbi:MAG: DUF1848 domain-containing protein [FCB group bacterium]|jgi:DNA repair photolyase